MTTTPFDGVDLAAHSLEVAELWQDYGRHANKRVPITFAVDENLWLSVSGHTFREFYSDPKVHLWAQLEGNRWLREHVLMDRTPGLPDTWYVAVQLWMEENEFCGAEVCYQEDSYAWAQPLPVEREALLPYLADLDPDERVRCNSAYRMYQALCELTADLTYCDRPVKVVPPGQGTHGVFTKAAELRGLEQLCTDLYEAPEWAETYLQAFTDLTLARLRAWRRACGVEGDLPLATNWGTPDDSLQLLSAASYRRFVLPCHQRLYAAMTTGAHTMHLCGYASQHYATLVRELGIISLDGPGPFVDHGRYLEELGPKLSFNAQTDHSILLHGTVAQVETMMHDMLTPGAKQPGRFNIVGYVARDTPLENVRACYRAGRACGVIE